MKLTDKQIKKMLEEIADEIRSRKVDSAEEREVVLTVAAIVEHSDPKLLR